MSRGSMYPEDELCVGGHVPEDCDEMVNSATLSVYGMLAGMNKEQVKSLHELGKQLRRITIKKFNSINWDIAKIILDIESKKEFDKYQLHIIRGGFDWVSLAGESMDEVVPQPEPIEMELYNQKGMFYNG